MHSSRPEVLARAIAATVLLLCTVSVAHAANVAPSFTLPAGSLSQAGETWVPRGPSGISNISALAASADGMKLAAAVYGNPGYIYISTDAGSTWTQRGPNHFWQSIASSADGTKLVASDQENGVFTSTDSGATWTARPGGKSFYRIASSADGTKLAGTLGADNVQLYVSTDSGVTWKARATKGSWLDITCSADGTKMAAVDLYRKIHTSSDSGTTWTPRGVDTNWNTIAFSGDGKKLFATGNGHVNVSTDLGVTWTALAPTTGWSWVKSSTDGSRLVAIEQAGGVGVYTSGDSGVTWTKRLDRYFPQLVSSADGTRLAAIGDQVYTSAGSLQSYAISVTATSGVYSASGFASGISAGPVDEAGQAVDFVVSNDNNALFTAQPAIDPTGKLTFTPGTVTGDATVTVTAHDNGGVEGGGADTSAAQTFVIHVLPISTDATLANLTLSSGTLSPSFDSGTLSYQASVEVAISSIIVTPTVNQINATAQVRVNGGSLGSPATPLALNIGANTVDIVVTPQDGAAPSKTYTVAVRRQPSETIKPTVAITTPAAAAKIAEGDFTVTGTAKDNLAVAKVEVKLNNGAYAEALTTPDGLNATYTITLPVGSARIGANTISVRSYDTNGNVSSVVSRNFTYEVIRPLTVNINGPDNSGSLPSPFPGTDSTTRKVGATYTLTATAKAGFVFDGWTASDTPATNITTASLALPTLTFVMREGLTLTANFVPNPFTADVAGSYTGLVTSNFEDGRSAATTGSVTATITAVTGAFSASLKINGQTYGVAGKFDNAGVARFGSKRTTSVMVINADRSSYIFTLALDTVTNPEPQLIGSLVYRRYGNGTTLGGEIRLYRNYYSTSNKVDPEITGVGSVKQAYTVRLSANRGVAVRRILSTKPSVIPGDPLFVDSPKGDGYATLQISPNGTATFSGKLADGTALTLSTPLSQSNGLALYSSLYKGKGCIAGWASINLDDPESDISGTRIAWLRPFQLVQWYPFGWEDGIDLDLAGAKFNPPATGTLFTDMGDSDEEMGNATLTLTEGQLTTPMAVTLNLTRADDGSTIATPVPDTDVRASVTFTTATGVVGGSFVHEDGTSTALQGVVIQKGTSVGAFGFFLTTMPTPMDYTGESGLMTIFSNAPGM